MVFNIDEDDKIALLKLQIVENKGEVEQYTDFNDEW
ncbi:hypothetical protein Clopa_3699 [Clostridium pasteurianum BC1]|uniref:Uncharacterized protein n=1 Tax=Clostridium pasteurianum BC1 TaxID=86416 RepID=R4K7D6_CLOPA|nr:hypothetical protein Clopa_3699 [Clostridium pasteurianum BC1]